MVTQNEEVHEVDHQLTEDNGKLVPADEHSSDIRRCHLTDIHRADSRSQSYADTTDDAIDIEYKEQGVERLTMFKENEFRFHRAQS